jgi:hypothetical protein
MSTFEDWLDNYKDKNPKKSIAKPKIWNFIYPLIILISFIILIVDLDDKNLWRLSMIKYGVLIPGIILSSFNILYLLKKSFS